MAEPTSYLVMHGVLAVSAVIILALMIWLAYVIATEERSPHVDES